MVVRLKVARSLVMHDGEIEVSQLTGDIAKHEERHVRVWVELCGPFKKGPCCRQSVPRYPLETFVDQFARAWCVREFRYRRRCRAQSVHHRFLNSGRRPAEGSADSLDKAPTHPI